MTRDKPPEMTDEKLAKLKVASKVMEIIPSKIYIKQEDVWCVDTRIEGFCVVYSRDNQFKCNFNDLVLY